MPTLAEKTRINTELGNISSTTGFNLIEKESWYSGRMPFDVNAYALASGSIRIQIRSHTPELSGKAVSILNRLLSYKKLQQNWDGNGAEVPNETTIKIAADFLALYDEYDLPVYFTAPGPNGEIVLEYKSDDKAAEIIFEENENPEMLLYTGNELCYSGEINKQQLIIHFQLT